MELKCQPPILDLESGFKPDFAVSELHKQILKAHGTDIISRTRLRTHLGGYVSPGKSSPLPECKDFVSEENQDIPLTVLLKKGLASKS